ncbi:hypothetical protein N7507_010021 [Penicillium longicatenatum]|nr:hypothetical protein N7507_010021 [Penicillium longicatenatum]
MAGTDFGFGPKATFCPSIDPSNPSKRVPINPALRFDPRSRDEVDLDLSAETPFDTTITLNYASRTKDKKRRRDYSDTEEPDTSAVIPDTTGNKEIGHFGPWEHYKQLRGRMEALQQENVLLKSWIDPDSIHQGQPFFQVVYRFEGRGGIYFKPPSWKRVHTEEGNIYTLNGNALSMKENEFLQRSSNLAFVVFKTYSPQTVDHPEDLGSQNGKAPPLPDPDSESLLFASSEMRRAVLNFLGQQEGF